MTATTNDNSFLRSFRSVGAMFRPPFDGLWLVVTLLFAWVFMVYPNSPIMRGDLPDTDDFMYLDQVLDWMSGQGWYDNIQHRLDPPNGVPIHFSRFAQLPMAAIIYFFEFLGLGPKGSATLMAMIYPVILLGCLFLALRWVAGLLMPKSWAGATAFVGLFATHMMFQFSPGHVDHHNLIIILVALAMGCVIRMIQNPDSHRWPLYTGLVLAFGNMIALEILPWLLLLTMAIGLWSVVKGGNAARGGLLYALTLFIASTFCLIVTRAPWDWGTLDVLTYSLVYVILMAGIAIAFAGVYLFSRLPFTVRFVLSGALSTGLGYLFLRQFPELAAGPYGGIDPALGRIILDEISEAQPMKDEDTSWLAIFWSMGPCVIGAPACLYFLWKARGVDRWVWSVVTAMLMAGLGLTLFYQRRFLGVAYMVQVLVLTMLLQHGWAWIGAHWRSRRQVCAEIGLLVLVGPLFSVFLPALADGRAFNTGVMLFPVNLSPAEIACETYELENVLRNPRGLGSKPHIIMNALDQGPELLFRTNDSVLAAPFHMDVQGNVDSTRFLSTPYPEEAEAIVRRRHVDLVVTCTYAEAMYFHTNAWSKDGAGPSGPSTDFAEHFVERLIRGHIPAWLKPVKVPGLNNYVIYEVLPPVEETPVPKRSGKKG
jgi:hypothetical protein